MRSSSTSCAARRLARGARLGLVVILALAAAPPELAAKGRKPPKHKPEEITNFLLSPRYSTWLLGPISWMASEQEIKGFLQVTDDEAAAEFIAEFWERRRGSADTPWPDDQPQAIFSRRALEADRIYSEGIRRGRTTDRGTIYVLYGKPEDVTYQSPPQKNRPPVEVWTYPKDAGPGLDGRAPKRAYYFAKRGDLTVFTNPLPAPRRRPF